MFTTLNTSAARRRPRLYYTPSERLVGLALVVVPAFFMIFVGSWAFTSHSTWQTPKTLTVASVNYVADDGGYENVSFDVGFESYPVNGWDTNIMTGAYNSFVHQGDTVQVWAKLGNDGFGGHHVVALSQTKWLPQLHWVRIAAFVVLLIITLACIIGGAIINLRRN